MDNSQTTIVRKKDKALLVAIGVIVIVMVCIAILGILLIHPPKETTQGQADCETVRVSGKLPGRIVKFYVHEGDYVHAGDTLVSIYSSTTDAMLYKAKSMQSVAASQKLKADKGTRDEMKRTAYNMYQQALAAETIAKKTYQRMQNLFSEGVVTEQKRDEAKAACDAASAQVKAAKSQYDMALKGAQKEDKDAARAMQNVAKGGVSEVQALLEDEYLVAPCDGEITDIYPNIGELVATGAPVMSILKTDDLWATFNVREELLEEFKQGAEVKVMIPGLGKKEAVMKVFYVHDLGSYAVWSSTKSTGQYDSRTFQIKARAEQPLEGLRPGMSVVQVK